MDGVNLDHDDEETNLVCSMDDHVTIDDDHVLLKERIVSHPLYDLLVHAHLNILKVTLGDIEKEVNCDGSSTVQSIIKDNKKLDVKSPDLDNFMESYCKVLDKLKEEMEKPMQETSDFIEAMYSELSSIVGPSSSTKKL